MKKQLTYFVSQATLMYLPHDYCVKPPFHKKADCCYLRRDPVAEGAILVIVVGSDVSRQGQPGTQTRALPCEPHVAVLNLRCMSIIVVFGLKQEEAMALMREHYVQPEGRPQVLAPARAARLNAYIHEDLLHEDRLYP